MFEARECQRENDMRRTLISLILVFSPLHVTASNLDDTAWLIYDKGFKDYFLLRVDMKSSMTGSAWIAGGNFYAGRRVLWRQFKKFKASMLGGQLTIMREGGVPILVANFDAKKDEIFGSFVDSNGNTVGEFIGTLKGHTYHQMDLFQICRDTDGYGRPRGEYRCQNRGKDQHCEHGAFKRSATFFSLQNCLDLLESTASVLD